MNKLFTAAPTASRVAFRYLAAEQSVVYKWHVAHRVPRCRTPSADHHLNPRSAAKNETPTVNRLRFVVLYWGSGDVVYRLLGGGEQYLDLYFSLLQRWR